MNSGKTKSLPVMVLFLAFIITSCSKSTLLSDCPDCGQTVSVRASECPHCGAPLSQDVSLNILDRASWIPEFDGNPNGDPVRLKFSYDYVYPDALSTADFEAINRLSTVRSLWLERSAFHSYTLSPLTTNYSLLQLSFFDCSLTDEDIKQIALIPNLISVRFSVCDFPAKSLGELMNSKSLREIAVSGADSSHLQVHEDWDVELDLQALVRLSTMKTVKELDFENCIFPSHWDSVFSDGFTNLVKVSLRDCNLTEDDVREMLKERNQNTLGGIDWQHSFVQLGDPDVEYDWDQTAHNIIQADIEGHSNWWAWFLGVLVLGAIGIGWRRLKLRTKPSYSIVEQISDLKEETSA